MKFIFNKIIFEPLYNGLILVSSIIPGGDLGISVVVLTIFVKVLLLPISRKAIVTQIKMKELEPKLREIKEKYKDSQEQAVKTMALYKDSGVNPFAGIFLVFIQIPILLALYWVFQGGIDLASPVIYSFNVKPEAISQTAFYIFDLSTPSYILAALVAITQFLQASVSLPKMEKPKKGGEMSFQDEFARSMGMQTKYFLPLFIAFISFKLNPALSIYWITNNLVSVIDELIVKKKLRSNV
ncbi:MAG: YidC/Oxa1 family membrane protein insertase [Candidatus Paceibacterota bacterium]|jgi:YidC/Oxa1 family membrane protein insertase